MSVRYSKRTFVLRTLDFVPKLAQKRAFALNAITKFAPCPGETMTKRPSLAENFVGNIKREIHQLTHIVCSDLVSILPPEITP